MKFGLNKDKFCKANETTNFTNKILFKKKIQIIVYKATATGLFNQSGRILERGGVLPSIV